MTFDPTITAGNILAALTFLVGLVIAQWRASLVIERRSVLFETTVSQHSRLLEQHADRMEKQDDLLLGISGDMQRIVGRLETFNPSSVAAAAAAAVAVIHEAEASARETLTAAAAAAAHRRTSRSTDANAR